MSRRLVMAYDFFIATCFGTDDELSSGSSHLSGASAGSSSMGMTVTDPTRAGSSSIIGSPITQMNDDDLELARRPSSSSIVAENDDVTISPTSASSSSGPSAIAVPSASASSSSIDWLSQQAEFDEAANARERANGQFSASELDDRQVCEICNLTFRLPLSLAFPLPHTLSFLHLEFSPSHHNARARIFSPIP